MQLRDRSSAGRRLASALGHSLPYDALLIGLAPGGVLVARAIADLLPAPIDILIARGVHAPDHPHFLLGAVAPGIVLMNRTLMHRLRATHAYVDTAIADALDDVVASERQFRGGRDADDVEGRTVVLVDDGLTSGKAVRVAIASLRQRNPKRLIFAAPFCDAQQAEMIQTIADEVVCLDYPRPFRSGHLFYEHLEPLRDADVEACLQFGRHEAPVEAYA